MPNWCINRATITAITDEAKKLLAEYDQHLSANNTDGNKNSKFFDYFLPIPQDLKDTTAGFIGGEEGEILKKKEHDNLVKHGYRNWYDWSIAKWGTKWDSGLDRNSIDGDTIEFCEDTAWGPPLEFYRHMEELGFEVNATYSEEGAGFYGSFSDGCESSEDIPSLSGAASIIRNSFNGYVNSYEVDEIDFDKIKTGDILTAKTGETFIYVSHEVITPQNIMEDYPQLDDPNLWDIDESFKSLAELDRNVYLVKVSFDQSKPGTESGIVYEDERTTIIFPEC